jgi:hypothetical protein
MIDTLDQTKAMDHKCHEAMVNGNIYIFEISHEESISYSKRLENLEKIRLTNSPGPATIQLDKKEVFSVVSSVGKFSKNASELPAKFH